MDHPDPPAVDTFIVVDFETTGGSYRDRVIQIGAVAVATRDAATRTSVGPPSDDGLDTFSRVVQSDGLCVSQRAFDVHGLDDRYIQQEGVPQSVAFSDFVAWMSARVSDSEAGALVAHNGFALDYRFLAQALRRLGISLPTKIRWACDTLPMGRLAFPDLASHRNEALYNHVTGLDGEPGTRTHDALQDARMTACVLCADRVWAFRVMARCCRPWINVRNRRLERAEYMLGRTMFDGSGEEDSSSSDEQKATASSAKDDSDESGRESGTDAAGVENDDTTYEEVAADNPIRRDRARQFMHRVGPARTVPCATPLATFRHLFHNRVVRLIVEQTNLYAVRKRAAVTIKRLAAYAVSIMRHRHGRTGSAGCSPRLPHCGYRSWTPLTEDELDRFLAVRGFCAMQRRALCWRLTSKLRSMPLRIMTAYSRERRFVST